MDVLWYLIAVVCHGVFCTDPQYIGTFFSQEDCTEVLIENIKRTPDPKEGQVLLCLDSENFKWPIFKEKPEKND